MSFKTENRKIKDLFEKSCQYVVPRYQRDYVWNKTNWSELISDIKFTLNSSNNLQWSHFLGTIVLNNKTDQDNNLANSGITLYEIVDGQQRLTTIYILFACIVYRFKEMKTEDSNSRVKYIHDTFLTSLAANSKRILMIDNEKMNHDLQYLITDVMNNQSITKNFFSDLFSYFYDEIKNYDFYELDGFLNKLLTINIVEIISDQEEEIYNIFEVLNARGRPLKQMELLKNHVMKYIQPHNNDYIDMAKEKWNKIEKNYSHLTDIDSLLIHFSKCYIKKDAESANKVYKLIKDEIRIEDLSILLESLYEYSNAYKRVTTPSIENEYIDYFDIKRNKQIRSLLAAVEVIFTKGTIDESIKLSVYRNLRNYFFIFNVCSHTSNKTDKIVSKASYDIYHCTTKNHFKMLLTKFFLDLEKMISNDENMKSMFINNQAFKYSNHNSAYKRNGRMVKYVLFNIYKSMQKDTNLSADQLTIEHLNSDDGSNDNSSIFNLTLTSSEINAEKLKNKPVVEKIKVLSEESSIFYNRNLSTYIINGVFDFSKRKEDLLNQIFDYFKFDTQCLGLTINEVHEYFSLLDQVSTNPDLTDLLMQTGRNFKANLFNNPKYSDLKQDFLTLYKG